MKIKIIFQRINGNRIPLAYNHILVSFIYRTIEESNSEYSAFLHDHGYLHKGKNFKLFTFSLLQTQNARVKPPFLYINSPFIELYLSSPIKEWVLHFVNGLFTKNEIFLGGRCSSIERTIGMDFSIKKVETLENPDFTQTIRVKSLSPITISTATVENNKMKAIYLDYRESLFKENIRKNLINKHEILHNSRPANTDFDFSFDDYYIQKRQGKISKLLDYNGTKIRGYTAPLSMWGNPDLVRLAYHAGLGDRGSMGFGCLV